MSDSSTTPATRTTDGDPRKIVHAALVDWLAEHTERVDRTDLHEAATAALDHIEDTMVEDGGDWSSPL